MKPALIRQLQVMFYGSILLLQSACKKEVIPLEDKNNTVLDMAAKHKEHGHLKQTNTFASDVAIKWMDIQLRLMKAAPTAMANVAFTRPYAYSGIALYEAVVPGMPAYQSITSQLSGLSGLPQTIPGYAYNWAVTANAALASINRKIFVSASVQDKTSVDSLEAAINLQYATADNATIMSRSIDFGKAVAQKIHDWAETDGYQQINNPYTLPVFQTGPAFWVPPPVPSIQSAPYWGNMRRLVATSGLQTQPAPPPSYSEQPTSAFYQMVKEVYDLSPAPGSEQAAMALYWRDVPGTTTPGHFVSILKQVLESEAPSLDVAARAYALGGIMVFDASISAWQTKYVYNLVRPINYIRNVMGNTTWLPFLGTPPHPEYPSAHASLSAANAEAFTSVFGEEYSFTDHTFDYLGFPSRSYDSFRDAAEEAGLSRLYGGIHYRNSIDVGLWQGRKVSQNIFQDLKFLKP